MHGRFLVVLTLIALLTAALPAAAEGPPPARSYEIADPPAVPGTTGRADPAAPPEGPNPILAFLPAGSTPDTAGWVRSTSGSTPAAPASSAFAAAIGHTEAEPAGSGGGNDTPATAEPVGTVAAGDQVSIDGTLGFTTTDVAALEDVGDTLATAQDVSADLPAFSTVTLTDVTIGDGPHGTSAGGVDAPGDFDFFALTLSQGERLTVDLDTADPFSGLDTVAAVYDDSGTVLAFNDDGNVAVSYDSFLTFTAPAAGTYTVAVGGRSDGVDGVTAASAMPSDPTTSGTGPGAETEGLFTLVLTRGLDIDSYALELTEGDVVYLRGTGVGDVQLFDPGVDLTIATFVNFLPSTTAAASPFSGLAGDVSGAVVAHQTGTHYLVTTLGDGPYTLNVDVARPGLAEEPGSNRQILFIDFDGAVVNPRIWSPTAPDEDRTVSPLASFIPGWGLTDEDALIDGILATVTEVLSEDLRVLDLAGDRDASLTPGEFDVEIRNSRDHADPFGQPDVSRVIVGGSIAEVGISTIGVAESIDVGNYDREESAITLLDLLSADATNPNSINQLDAGGDKNGLVAQVVGHVTAHEAGHMLGSFHTDNGSAIASIMDQGGDLPAFSGVGPDGVFGTGDDVDVTITTDAYAAEGFVGDDHTDHHTTFALLTGQTAPVAPLTPPTALAPTGGVLSMALEWTPPDDDGGDDIVATTMEVYDASDTLVDTITGGVRQPLTATGLAPGDHYVVLTSRNHAGDSPSATSATFTVHAEPPPPPPPPSPPPPPPPAPTTPTAPTVRVINVTVELQGPDLLVSWQVEDASGFAQAGQDDPIRFRVEATDDTGAVAAATTVDASPALLTGVPAATTVAVSVTPFNDVGDGVTATAQEPATTPPAPPTAERIGSDGPVRAQAIDVCRALIATEHGAARVVLARDDAFADALAGAPLAGPDGCILFSEGGPEGRLDPQVATEIDRALAPAGEVLVLGGPNAVSEATVQALADFDVTRFAGPSRVETAVAIAEEVTARTGADAALLAFAFNFPDALAGGAYAARAGLPILLSGTEQLHPATAAALEAMEITDVTLLGGTAVLSDAVADALPASGRVAGPNRMATAAAIAGQLWAGLADPEARVLVNTELDDAWVLALAAAPLAASLDAPQLGVGLDRVPQETATALDGVLQVLIVGGTTHVSAAVAEQVAAALGG